MPLDHVELAELGLKAFNERDAELLQPHTHDDFEFRPSLTLIEGGSYRGLDGFRRYLAVVDDDWEDLHVEATELRDLGDRVVALGRMAGRGRGSGIDVTGEMAWVVDFRDGKILRWRTFTSHAEALAEGGE